MENQEPMNDREILAACLRWHTAHVRRLEIGAEQRRYQIEQKQRTGFGGSDYEISQRLTAAKRPEQAALRALAAICAKVRGSHIDDADVIDVPMLLTHEPELVAGLPTLDGLQPFDTTGLAAMPDTHPGDRRSSRRKVSGT